MAVFGASGVSMFGPNERVETVPKEALKYLAPALCDVRQRAGVFWKVLASSFS